jgi:hypothetical protein
MKLLSMINRNTISIKINIKCSGWPNCTSHVMVNMLASNVVDRGFKFQSGQTIKLMFAATLLSMLH